MSKKPFFFRIESAELMNFATDPEGEGMSLLRFAKELQRGSSNIPFIQGIIDETLEFSQKKRDAANKRWNAKNMQTDAVHSGAMPETEAVTEEPKPIVQKSESSKEAIERRFNSWWDVFNDKRDRKKSLAAFIKINPGKELFGLMIDGAKRYAADRPALIERKGTPKMAQGWLNDARWEDETSSVAKKDRYSIANIT